MSRSIQKQTTRVAAASLVAVLLAACGSDLTDAELLAGAGATGGSAAVASPASGGAAGQGLPGGVASAGASASGAVSGPEGSTDPATAGPTGGGAAPTDPTGGAAAIPQATDTTPIRIGTLGVFSGVLGTAMQPGLDAIKAWVNATNAAGGLGGRPIELVVADDRGDPNLAVQLAQRLVETDRVVAILGSMQPATVQAVVDYFDQVQVPVIGTCACTPATGGHPMFFPVGATDGPGVTWGHIAGIFGATEARKAAVFYCREAATCTLYRNSLQQYEGHDGLDIVYEAQISLAAPDFTAEVLAARNAGAEIIISVTENPTAIRIMRSAHRQGYNPVLSVQHGGDDSNFVADGGSEIEGAVYTSTTASWATSPLMADYRDAIAQYAPDGSLGSLGSPLWMSGEMLERVAQTFPIDRAVTSADIIEGLYSLQGETLGGRVAPTTYNRGGGNELANTCIVPMAIRGGQPTPQIGPEEFVCAPR